MSTVNVGSQRIGWKFSTPLQADYLNTFSAGLTTPGLLTRPLIVPSVTSYGADIVIHPFSLLIPPEDKIDNRIKDENGEVIFQKVVKITTTDNILLSITPETVAIGFSYTFTNNFITQSQWYGEVVVLDMADLVEFKGIIIATCQNYRSPENTMHYSITTSGADISDALLIKEGWNPQKWLSVIHPTRSNGIFNKLEVRTHNNSYSGYMNGQVGLVKQENLTYQFDYAVDHIYNPDGIRGLMAKNFSGFKLQSMGFGLAEQNDTLPIEKTSGGVFALVDATDVNRMEYNNSFVNKLKIYPVHQEDINFYIDGTTAYIR